MAKMKIEDVKLESECKLESSRVKRVETMWLDT